MRHHSQWLRLSATVVGLSLIAAACGGDDDDEEASDDTGTETTEAGETTESTIDYGALVEPPPEGAAEPSCTGDSDGALSIGALLPETGNLSFLGPPMVAGAQLAVEEINAAGGVLGQEVAYTGGDSGDTSTDIATQTVDSHLNAGVDVILGAASSGVTFTVLDAATGACKIVFSPAATSPDFTVAEDDDLFFRTAPSDVLQGRVAADNIVNGGNETVAILALDDPYGRGLLEFTRRPLEEAGVEVVVETIYDPQAQNFDAEVEEVVSADPDALQLIGFDESARILTALFEQGFSSAEGKNIYLVDGNTGNALGEQFDQPGVLEGITGTAPLAEVTPEFQEALVGVNPGLIDFLYGPETYDAVTITALATELAGTDEPAAVAREINGVTRDGEACTTFVQCRDLIAGGTTDIDYDGPSGPQSFSQVGEPTEATIAIQTFGPDNTLLPEQTEYVAATF